MIDTSIVRMPPDSQRFQRPKGTFKAPCGASVGSNLRGITHLVTTYSLLVANRRPDEGNILFL
jgi:hypothetical protein